MSGERYVEHAINSLHAAMINATTGFVAQLRALETTQSLHVNSLKDPRVFYKARVPGSNEVPALHIYDDGWQWDSQRNQLMVVDAQIDIAYSMPNNDIEAGELMMRRYVTALAQVVEADPSLGSQVVACVLTAGESSREIGDSSVMRIVYSQGFAILVDSR